MLLMVTLSVAQAHYNHHVPPHAPGPQHHTAAPKHHRHNGRHALALVSVPTELASSPGNGGVDHAQEQGHHGRHASTPAALGDHGQHG